MAAARVAIVAALAGVVVRSLAVTLRVRVEGVEHVEPMWRQGRAVIYVVWHGRILMVPWLNAWLRRRRTARAPVVLASRSRDGEIVARYLKGFGLPVVRGSSSRDGAAALRQLVGEVRRGLDVAIVPDGPRGPREALQPGTVALAALTGAPVVPVAVSASPARRLHTWDRFLVPWPFARCVLVFGPPLRFGPADDRARAGKEIELALRETTERADALAAGAVAG